MVDVTDGVYEWMGGWLDDKWQMVDVTGRSSRTNNARVVNLITYG